MVEQIHRRVVELAVENKVVQGRKMRVDTTVCETNIHYPTDSSLLGDGDRVLTRLMKKVTAQRWFKKGQKWRTGCEGRISLLKRRHGLRRSLYKKDAGIKRWVGLGVIADNLINLGKAMK